MENIILQKTRYLKALMLTMLVGLFAFGASAQISNTVAPDDALLHYIDNDSLVTYDATQQSTGSSSMYLFSSFPFNGESLLGEGGFGTGQTINFTWPSIPNDYDLYLVEGEGDPNNPSETIDPSNLNVLLSDNTSYPYFFNKSGARQVTTDPADLTGETVRVSVTIDVVNADLTDSLLVQYSTNGTSYTNLVAASLEEKLGSDGTYDFDLPAGAISATTRLRVVQENSGSIGQNDDTWYLDDLQLEFGDPFNIVDLVYFGNYTVSLYTIDVVSIVDDQDNPITNGDFIYPRDTITLTADALGFDFAEYKYVAYAENTVNSETYKLSNQVVTTTTPDTLIIEGSIPLNIPYNENWRFYIKAFDLNDTEGIIGDNYSELTGGDSEFFEDEGERAYGTEGYALNSVNGTLTFYLDPLSDEIYPAGTEIEVQYSTDSVTFTTLGEVNLNDAASGGSTFIVDEWPAGVVSNTTYFRFQQNNTNGQGLNGWEISNIFIDVNSNIINGSLFDYTAFGNIDVDEPLIELEVYDILANGEVFPGSTINLSYSILDGAFPAGTVLEGLLERNDLAYDIILGSSTTLNGTLQASVPAVIGGDYDIYLTANGAVYDAVTLPISGVEIEIDSIKGNPTVVYQGADYVYPGSEITSYYSIFGTPGAGVQLLLQVEDNASGEFVTVGTESTLNGSISATLPDSIDYTGNLQLVLSDGQQLIGGNTTFIIDRGPTNTSTTLGADEDLFSEIEGTFGGLNALFRDAGTRSATTIPFDVSAGALVSFGVYLNGNPGLNYDVTLQASIDDGMEWADLSSLTLSNASTFSFVNSPDILLVDSLLTENTIFRIISNEDGSQGANQGLYYLSKFRVEVPVRSDLALATGTFNILKPNLSVETIETNLLVGDEITIDFNVTGPFPTNTWIAAVIEDSGSGEYQLIGEAEAVEIGSITGTLPLLPETMTGNAYDQIKLVPYIKATTETQYEQGSNIEVENEEDFLVIEGDNSPDFNALYAYMEEAGNRSVLTEAYDLSGVSSASIEFGFWDTDDSFEMDGNLNVVPRLQVSIDGGASFEEIPINETNEEVGLLFESDNNYLVEIPAEYLTAATHFRWVQPLNLGSGNNTWELYDVTVILGEMNALQTYYTTTDDVQGVTLDIPSLIAYEWMQADLQDPVFNGETFSYSWDFDPEADTTLYEDFPAGTEFVFTLDGVIDPETGEELIIGTSSSLGVASANIPLYVSNGNYDVNVAAFIEVGEMQYPYYDFSDNEFAGSLDVFNQVLETTFDGNANEVYYAGNEVTVNYAFENDVTSTAFTDLQYNLILNYNGDRWLLAVDESFTGSFTVDMPPFVTGGVDFIVEASEGGPLGTVGEILDPTSIDLNDADSWINDEVALVDNNDLPGGTNAELAAVSGRRVLTTTDFDLVAENAASLSFELTVDNNGNQIDIDDVLADQQLIFEYSTDGGATYTELETFLTEGDENGLVDFNIPRTYQLDGDIITASTRFRFRQEESRFTILIENMTISEAGKAQIDYVSAATNGFVPSISQQSVQITAIDGDAACISDEVTLDYEIRGKFGADNLVSVMLGDDNALFVNVPSNTMTVYGAQNNNSENVGGYTFGGNMDFWGQTFRYAYTQSYDLSGYGTGALTASITKQNSGGNPFNEAILVYYSTDGGSSFTEFGSIGSGGSFTFDLPQAALVDDVIFRLEQPYSGGNRFNDQDRWRFDGLTVEASNISIGDAYVFNITEGSGSISFELPANAVLAGDNNQLFKFRLKANDDTYEAIGEDYVVTGTYTETSLEVVAPINENATFSVADPLACSTEDVIVSINAGNMQDYFLYEVLDGAGTVLGSLERDPLDPQNEINIGQITAATDLQLRVTSQSSTGTVCNTLITDEGDVEVLANFELYSELDDDNFSQLVAAGDELTTCNGASEFTLTLERMRENADNEVANGSSDATVEWFRDNANNLVGSQYTLTDANVTESGAYYARITDGSCIYTTESIQINVIETPDQPEITVVSGDLIGCESSAEDVVLEAPEGFAYYSWSSGEATRSITVEEEGSYSVTVSNVAGGGCATATSLLVDVTRYDTPDFEVSLTTNTNGLIGANEVLDVCAASDIIYFFENDSYGNNGIVEVIKDGVSIENVTSNSYTVTESGVYSFVWNFNSLNVEGCTASSVEFTVNLNDVADVTPTIAVTGDLNSCDPENVVTLEGPEGFANYVWSRGSTALSVNARSISVSQGGSYTLQVSNVDLNDNCGLSNSSSPVVVNAAPDADDYQLRLISYGYLTDGEEVDICSDDVNNTIEVRRGTSTNLLGATVKWFRDGAEFTPNFDNNTVVISESGVYNAEVKLGQCAVATYAVTINIVATPDAPVLASTGALSFCEGEGTVTLTAPAGFDYYTWRRGTTLMNSTTNGLANSNVIEVSTTGSYTVTVSNSATDCASDLSNPIVVNVVDEPNLPSLNQVNTTCGDGAIEFSINNNNNGGSAMTYQLYNGETGQASGNPVTIQGNQIGSIFTDVLTEDGIPFYVEAMYADGTGCSHVDPAITREANVRTITLEIEGATLTASYDGNADVRWYRNEVLLANATGNNSITIADAAEYTVEVEYANGCLLTASSADIDGRVLSNRDAMDMQVTSYPNPTQSDVTLNVSSQYMGKHEVIITSMTGQIMMQSSFEKSSFEANHAMNVANLQEGIYNVQIRHDGLTQNVRIIKK